MIARAADPRFGTQLGATCPQLSDPKHGRQTIGNRSTKVHVEIRITCARAHPLATFAPILRTGEDSVWVGDLDSLQSAPWESWSLIAEMARPADSETRPSLHLTHDPARADRDGDDWRFYCKRCRRPMRLSDSVLGSAVTHAATHGEHSLNVESLC